ncbi:MAG: glycosyltransferase family 4 protein [Hydrogenophilaceae bacterium]|nr:glycosyltransferase family 4 protein [Hydrogenophilaceae bacterium]
MATVIDDMAHSSLSKAVDLVLFDTKKRTRDQRTIWEAIRMRFLLLREWWHVLQPAKVTIAHIHTCSGLSFFLDSLYMMLARIRGVPAALHIHGAKFDEFFDGLSWPGKRVVRFLANRASRVIVLSGEWERALREQFPKARFAVIENGVSQAPLIDVKKDSSVITVLFLGNLCHRKGVMDLISSARDLPPYVRIVLVGGEEEPGMTEKVKRFLEQESLEERVLLAGPATGIEKFRWLRSADIFALPSYAEGVPISMLEALAVGLPAVVTPVGGIPSVLTDKEHALFVQPGDRAALVSAITRLANDENLRRTLGETARAHVMENFGVERSASKYLQVYRELKPRLADRGLPL